MPRRWYYRSASSLPDNRRPKAAGGSMGADREQLATGTDLSQLETRLINRLYAVAAGIVGSNVAIAGVIVALTA